MNREKIIEVIEATQIGYLATVDTEGLPRVRPVDAGTVYDGEPHFSTFCDSRKVGQLEANPQVEIVWLSKDMLQVRLNGTASEVKDSMLRDRYLRDKPDTARLFSEDNRTKYRLYKIEPAQVEYIGPDDVSYTSVVW